MIDTHAHLDALREPPEKVLERARLAGVSRVVTIGSGLRSCRESLALADRETGVYAALGIHPHQAGTARDGELRELAALLAHGKAVAVGEAGVDHFRDRAPRERQLELFHAQAALANETGKPLVVHSRAAEAETLAVLAEHEPRTVVLHCFSSVGLLRAALERRWYVSFAGNVTYPKAEDLRRAAAEVPGDRLLAETDSPYLAPQPVRGRPNEPAHVVHTLAALAAARGDDADELERQIEENAARAFALS